MATRVFDYIELKYDSLSSQMNSWLSSFYKKSGQLFNSASPYGQIVNVLKELFQHNIIYTKQAVNTMNIEESINEKVIKNVARISGYSPSRPLSATGTLKFTLKNIDINEKIKGGGFTMTNKMSMKNKSNGLFYCSDISINQMVIPIKAGTIFFIPIIQGIWKQQTFTGNGKPNQSYTVQVGNNANVENFRYTVRYNTVLLSVRDHLYDIRQFESGCYTRTGFNGGLDVYFGTMDYGFIPAEGSTITVDYLVSNGTLGEILTPMSNDWIFMTPIKDIEGNELALDKLFDITVETNINFASNGESVENIKANIPYVSRNFILATPSQFIFHLGKLNMFSKINAFNKLDDNNFSMSEVSVEDSINQLRAAVNTNKSVGVINLKMDKFLKTYSEYKNNLNDNEIYLYLIPSVTKYFTNNVNYFNVPYDVFYLDDNEQSKVLTYLNATGIMSITTEVVIIQPTIVRYVMNVYVRRFSNIQEDNIRQQIIQNLSNYLISNNRFDRIPKSDIINLLKTNVAGIDSVDVYFICKKNEDYHAKGKTLGYVDSVAYDSKNILGLDPVHGDIVIGQDEYPIIRGGWKDRNGVWFNEDPSNLNGLTSINIIFNGITNTK